MPQDVISFMERLNEYGVFGYIWILFVSFWAGTVRYLTSLKGNKPTFFGWIIETIISGFVGIIVAMTCQYFKVDFLLTSAITGIAAHNGTRSIYLVGEIIKKNTNLIGSVIEEPEQYSKTLYSRKKD